MSDNTLRDQALTNQPRPFTETGSAIHNYDSDAPVAGQEWTTEQMTKEFEAIGFAAPFVIVKRRSDGKRGTLEFKHSPRVYFNWQEDL